MAIAAGFAPNDAPAERRPGEFRRDANGTPRVTTPDGEVVKSGPNKGQPKTTPYSRPSGYGKLIEDTTNLQKWAERMIVAGFVLGLDDDTGRQLDQAPPIDPDGDEWREFADAVARKAKERAKHMLAAERGTHAHELTELSDTERDPIVLLERGEVLGIDAAVSQRLIHAWSTMLQTYGLEVLATELAVVNDEYRAAGTLDRIVRLTRPLSFVIAGGEIVTLPAGLVVVLDIKTGKLRTKGNEVQWWASYAPQVFLYASATGYDVDREVRYELPWAIEQRWAIIAHLDVLAAIDGEERCELILVDLEAGRRACDLVKAAKEHNRQPMFSLVGTCRVADEIAAPGVASPVIAEGDGNRPEAEQPAAECDDSAATIASPEAYAPGDAGPSTGEAPATSPVLTPAEQHRALDERGTPDEGGPADPAAVLALERAYHGLDAVANDVIRQLVREAQHGRVPFHLRDHHTVRRFELVRGLVAVAPLVDDERETLRCILAAVVGDVAHFANVTPGHVLGTLSAAEAALFACLCDEFVADAVPAEIDEATGQVVLRFPSLAAAAA